MLGKSLGKVIRCSKCGKTKFTLRVKDEHGKKIEPVEYICVKCAK